MGSPSADFRSPGPPARRHWVRMLVWVVLIVLAVVVYRHLVRFRVFPPESAAQATPIALADLSGEPVRLEELRGSVVLLSFWASWCAPCRREAPLLNELHRRLAGEGLVVLGLNADVDATPEQIRKIAASWELDYRVLLPAGPLTGTFAEPDLIPHTWLIDRRGRVRASHSGVIPLRVLSEACRQLLEE